LKIKGFSRSDDLFSYSKFAFNSRAIMNRDFPESKKKRGRPALYDDDVLDDAKMKARGYDLERNSWSADGRAFMSSLTSAQAAKTGGVGIDAAVRNPSLSSKKIYLKRILPVTVTGCHQNYSRLRALRDIRNALSLCIIWACAVFGIQPDNTKCYDEVAMVLNNFNPRTKVRLAEGSKEILQERNLAPAITHTQADKRRSLTLGIAASAGNGRIDCCNLMIYDRNIPAPRRFRVSTAMHHSS
jgi:hypothetical protein